MRTCSRRKGRRAPPVCGSCVASAFAPTTAPSSSRRIAPRRCSNAESIAILFRDSAGARKALAVFERRQRAEGRGVTDLSADGLGEEAWALRGVFFPGAPPTFFYAWRRDNLLQVFALAGKPQAVSEADARAYAEKLDNAGGSAGVRTAAGAVAAARWPRGQPGARCHGRAPSSAGR